MYYTTELYHHGVKGQKWGIRRYQNEDGTLKSAGVGRYSSKYDSVKEFEGNNRTGFKKVKHDIRTYLGNKTGHYSRNDANVNLPKNDADAKRKGWVKLTDKQSAMHQYNKSDGVLNSKWVSADGHREVVFTGKGKNQHITKDARDEGTYNFSDPNKDPLGHTVKDVLPYIFLGNSADDKTTTFGRLYGSAANFLNKPISADPEIKNKGKKAVYDLIMVHADIYSDELYHHGIKGQKWGIRRYQNPDGSYTEEGKKRYGRNKERPLTIKDFKNDGGILARYTDDEWNIIVDPLRMEWKYGQTVDKSIAKINEARNDKKTIENIRLASLKDLVDKGGWPTPPTLKYLGVSLNRDNSIEYMYKVLDEDEWLGVATTEIDDKKKPMWFGYDD